MTAAPKTKILFLAANPADTTRLAVTTEYQEIGARLRSAKHRDAFELQPQFEIRARQLPGLIMRFEPQVLHFSGHGSADNQLLFHGADDLAVAADPQVIADVFGVLKGIRCVVLNACYSEAQARLIAAHVDTVIGMSDAISDRSAIEFAAGFYEGLGYGQSVAATFKLGKIGIGLGGQVGRHVPVLHVRPGVDAERVFLHELGETKGELSQLDAEHERLTLAGEDVSEVGERRLELIRARRSGPSLAVDDVLAGRYRLVERAGAGGFATVWKAYDRERRELVAIKLLHGQWAHDRSRVKRFVSGARRMAALEHPAVVKVLEPPAQDGEHRHFCVMRWFEGGDLDRAVCEGGLGRAQALAAIARVLDGLAYAHGQGVVHRDVKPANILLDADGRGHLTDFDLARAQDSTHGTKAGAGTFAYAAPEQQRDASGVDERADVYGAGMCVLFALSGAHPEPLEAAYKPEVLDGLKCGAGLRGALKGAVTLKVEDRTTSCVELAAAIRGELGEAAPEQARRRSDLLPPERVVVPSKRWVDAFTQWWLVAGFVGLIAAGVGLWVFGADEEGISDSDDAKDTITVHGVELVVIPGGRFMMGSPPGEDGRDPDEGPQHEVELASFYLAKTEVTNAQYDVFLKANPDVAEPRFWDDESYNQPTQPVVGVSWIEAKAYCDWAGLVLPTEAQWEYAARAGTTTRYWSGDTEDDLARVGWYKVNSGGQPHAVAQKEPNAFGLYDVHGNVWEWCLDAWGDYETSPRAKDGLRHEPVGDARRVVRGGGWFYDAHDARSAYRFRYAPGQRSLYLGFRPAQGRP